MSFPKKSLGHHRRSLEFGKQNNSFIFLAKRKKRKQTIWIWRSDRWETGTGPPIRTTFMCPTVRVFLCHCHSREENGLKFCFFFPIILYYSLFFQKIFVILSTRLGTQEHPGFEHLSFDLRAQSAVMVLSFHWILCALFLEPCTC